MPVTPEIQVMFRLNFARRFDERAGVHVGYCPALGIYSQGATESEAETAIVNAAKLFIITCYGRDILHKVLRNQGMTKAVAFDMEELLKQEEQEFIAIRPQFEAEFARDVSISLVPGNEVANACQN
jgi:hypothetical protein